ncbi:MAG TPA: head GIN domain-containing protein [Lacibacter sp.]|nr:head GIN domain-containing protein [Lacibacter sp.]
MKQLFLFIALVFAGSVLQAQDLMVVNDKNAEVRTINGSFHGIKVSHAIQVFVKQGNDEAVVVSAVDEKWRSRIKVEVKEGILRIWFDNDGVRWNWNMGDKKLRAYVSVKNLDMIEASGASDVKIDGLLKGNQLNVKLSGASSLKGELSYSKMIVEQSGASGSNVSGRVNELVINSSGASDFKGFDLTSDYCIAEASGASDIKVTVTKDLKVEATGASDIDYRGGAVISSFKSTGASSVRKRSK